MNKKNMLWILLGLVFQAVFNSIFFAAGGTEHVTSVWIAYGFIHFAYLMLLATPLLIRKSGNAVVLGLPLYAISSIYFIVTFVVGVVFIFVHPKSYKASLIAEFFIVGIYAFILIIYMIANEGTAGSIERHEMELRYIRDSSSKLKGIMDSINDKLLLKKVEKLYDLIHASPVKSNKSVYSYEIEVLKLIDKLDSNIRKNDAVAVEEIMRKIECNASERNRRLQCRN